MHRELRIVIKVAGAAALAVVLTGTLAYKAGRESTQDRLRELQAEVASLKQEQADATVARRVSKQLEDIAYEQKAISDEQKDRAEQQTALAIQMRHNAELESQAARQAEAKAAQAAEQESQQRALAEQQQREAESQRDLARHAKLVSDTLNYRSLGRSLAKTISGDKDTDIPSLLAYGSWMYIKRYKSNTYNPDTFKALEEQSGLSATARLATRSSVHAMATLPDGDGCVAVTNYGDVVKWQDRQQPEMLLCDASFDFRGVAIDAKGNIYALSLNGPLLKIEPSSREVTRIALPEDKYLSLLPLDDNTLLLAAKRSLVLYDIPSGTERKVLRLGSELSALCRRGEEVCLFYADGSCGTLNGEGTISPRTPYVKGVVTAATYDETLECLILGLASGHLCYFNRYDRQVTTHSSHNARVTGLAVVDGILISIGYDRKLCVWNMLDYQLPSGCRFADEMASRLPLTKPSGDGLGTEWVPSVDYFYGSWPLAITSDEGRHRFWMGTGDGQLVTMNTSTDEMATTIKHRLTRNFTQQEWEHYVGMNVPYEKFR